MALEKSVLNSDVISDLLHNHYNISVYDIHRLKLGTANCYRVYDGTKYYFLKEFQSSFSESTVIQEAKLLEFLSNTDIPVTRFYRTISGDYVIRYKNHIICLEEYIEGQAYGYDDLPPHLLNKVGRMLGMLHRALKDYPLPIDMSDTWLSSFSSKNMIAKYDSLLNIAHTKTNDDNIEKIIFDLQYKKQLAIRYEDYKKYYRGITYCPTHGDYQGCQMIFDGEEIKAVIDFSSARSLPVTWEIMRSFVQSSVQCRKSAIVDIKALCDYTCEYMKYATLTKSDLKSMPYVYLLQLARSQYGYPQYLSSDSEERERLLQFAFWRTDMCREVEKNAEAIGDNLLKILPANL